MADTQAVSLVGGTQAVSMAGTHAVSLFGTQAVSSADTQAVSLLLLRLDDSKGDIFL